MRSSLVLIEGDHATAEQLMISLRNAKQRVLVPPVWDYGHVVHVAADSSSDLEAALRDLAAVENVTGVITLATRLTD
jgi:hypothetical protein